MFRVKQPSIFQVKRFLKCPLLALVYCKSELLENRKSSITYFILENSTFVEKDRHQFTAVFMYHSVQVCFRKFYLVEATVVSQIFVPFKMCLLTQPLNECEGTQPFNMMGQIYLCG